MRLFFSIALLFFCLHVPSLHAQLTPQEALQQMGRGINLGNTLEPPEEGGWNNPPAEEFYFDAYKSAGFSTVRIPVRWDKHTADTFPYTVDPAWMARVEQVAGWGLDRGFFVIINAHHEEWLKSNYTSVDTVARFHAIWRQIAEHFKDKSDHLLFEIINEPYGMTVDQVDELNADVLAIIRESNPTRIVIYSGNRWSNTEELMAAKIPDDDYIMGYFHSYNPWNFAGKGEGTWGTAADKAAVRNRFSTVAGWAKDHNLAIMISEFGAVNSCDFNSRMRFYGCYVRNALLNGIPFMVWDDGGQFAVYARRDHLWYPPKDIVIYTTPASPDDLRGLDSEEGIRLQWANHGTYRQLVLERGLSLQEMDTVAGLPPDTSVWTDTPSVAGVYYYRLKALTQDSTPAWSPPYRIYYGATGISSAGDTKISIFPNPLPAGRFLHISTGPLLPGEEYLYELYNTTGALVAAGTIRGRSGQQVIAAGPTARRPGTYLFILKKEEQNIFSTKVVFR